MCLGIPMELVSTDGIAGLCRDGAQQVMIDFSLLGTQKPGTWVLTFLGTAREVLDPDEAQKITAALEGLRAVMQGSDPGGAFADLEARSPCLPPHLQAALAAGKATG